MNKRKKVLWTSPLPQTITKSSINLFHHQIHLKTWASRRNPSAAFKSYWRASQERERLGSLLNPKVQLPEPQAWLSAPMLGGEPLTDDISIRDYNGGIGYHVASILEETLLLPKDMVELRGLRRNEVFLQAKRFLGMVCIFTP